LVLAKRQLTDSMSVVLVIVTVAVLLKYKKFPEPFIILLAAMFGFIIKSYL
jgi:chromate transporter